MTSSELMTIALDVQSLSDMIKRRRTDRLSYPFNLTPTLALKRRFAWDTHDKVQHTTCVALARGTLVFGAFWTKTKKGGPLGPLRGLTEGLWKAFQRQLRQNKRTNM